MAGASRFDSGPIGPAISSDRALQAMENDADGVDVVSGDL
jgi:hypothetical protein